LLWSIRIDEEALLMLSVASRGTARVGLRLLRRVRDYLESINGKEVSTDTVEKTMKLLGIDDLGLENIDREILRVVYFNFNGGPVGVSTLAASVSEEISTLLDVHEPYLMKCGLLKRTSRGRVLTEKGIRYVESIYGE
jgi:holliday junction DNA helicase RuvB